MVQQAGLPVTLKDRWREAWAIRTDYLQSIYQTGIQLFGLPVDRLIDLPGVLLVDLLVDLQGSFVWLKGDASELYCLQVELLAS